MAYIQHQISIVRDQKILKNNFKLSQPTEGSEQTLPELLEQTMTIEIDSDLMPKEIEVTC